MTAFNFDANNRIMSNAVNPIAVVVDGLPFDASGNLCVTDSNTAPVIYVNGWPFEATGRLAIHHGGLTAVKQNGRPFTGSGRVSSDNANAVTGYQNGLPLTISRLSVA